MKVVHPDICNKFLFGGVFFRQNLPVEKAWTVLFARRM